MAPKKKCKVFVSYSRHDEALVRPLAGLLGVAADDAVFLDVTSLKPGELWEKEIFVALNEASVFIVCWCCESKKSKNVNKEIRAALSDKRKKLVPVLFCGTPLPTSLAERQWTDLRGRVVHECAVNHTKEEGVRGGRQKVNDAAWRGPVEGPEEGLRAQRAKELRNVELAGVSYQSPDVLSQKREFQRLNNPMNPANPAGRYAPDSPFPSWLVWSVLAAIVAVGALVFHFFGGRTLLRVAEWAVGVVGLLAILFVVLAVSARNDPLERHVGLGRKMNKVQRKTPQPIHDTEADIIASRARGYFESLAEK